ncbi:MAG TPA: cell wall metabolism sensor histidine kinase WalK, partial [Epulopiscium sp.]|nr:cell wall metabolism sensor histidine kinase WalK [Candidatus Epulonipiscium sp.]
ISRERNIYVEVVLAEEETWVSADREQIIRVLHNLLENAFKFVEDKGLILIETTYNGDKVHVAISNSGGFIPKKDIPYIWDRFHKVDRSRSKDQIGTGLGLAIVKGIIRHHNEEIWVVSEKEKLTTFTFSLSKISKGI